MIIKGILFNNIHTFRDLNLVLNPFEESVPDVKENYIDVPGSDDGLDLTAAQGEVKYKFREFDLSFSVLPEDDWEAKKRQVDNLLHGLQCEIIFDRNPNYKLTGRIKVSNHKSNKRNRQIVIRCKTKAYWLKTTESVYTCTFGASKNLAPRFNTWDINDNHNNLVQGDTATVSGTINVKSPYIDYNGGPLSFSAVCSEPSVRCYFWSFDVDDNCTKHSFYLTNGKRENYIPPDDCVRYKVKIIPGSSAGNIYVSKFQIEEGAACTAYEPKDGILITNGNKAVIPTITLSDSATIEDNEHNKYMLSAGTHKVLDISVPTGESIITGTGTGTMTVKFTERAL